MPQGESPTVGGGSPQRAAVPDRGECAERPGWEEGRQGRGMSRSPPWREKLPALRALPAPGATPACLRHSDSLAPPGGDISSLRGTVSVISK